MASLGQRAGTEEVVVLDGLEHAAGAPGACEDHPVEVGQAGQLARAVGGDHGAERIAAQHVLVGSHATGDQQVIERLQQSKSIEAYVEKLLPCVDKLLVLDYRPQETLID